MYGDRIRCLRKYFKLTQGDLAHAVGFKSASAVGMIERGEREVSFEMLGKLADFFNVTTDFLLGKTDFVKCPICSIEYCPLLDDEFNDHQKIHTNFLKSNLNDDFINYNLRKKLKNKSKEVIESNNSSLIDKINSSIDLFKCYYSRSLEASDFNNKHAKLDDFIAMMLNQENTKEYLPPAVYKELVKRYGTKEGIKNGSSYFSCNNALLLNINVPPIKTYSDDEKKLISNYNKLNNLGKNKLLEYSNDLIETPKYKDDTDSKVVEIHTNSKEILKETKDELSATLNSTQNDKIIRLSEDQKIEKLQDYFTTIAAHNDNLTEEEKIIAEQKVLEALRKNNLI